MKRTAVAACAALSLFALFPGRCLSQTVFIFYGISFGMTVEDVKKVFPALQGNEVKDPGHGMSNLELYFDRESRLMEIRASYPKPTGQLESIGMQRALKEKFLAPVRENHPDITANIDQSGNFAAMTVVFQSNAVRDSNIEYYKKEFLRLLE